MMDEMTLKKPPYNIEAEQSVLGGIMLDASGWDRIVDVVSEGDFYRTDHRLIFRALAMSIAEHKPVDVVTLSETLEHFGQDGETGGLSYLGMLANNTPSAANIKHYAEIVKERSMLRQLIALATQITDSAFSMLPTEEIAGIAERELTALMAKRRSTGPVMIKEALQTFIVDLEERFSSKKTFVGLPTHFTDIDERLSGLQPGDLIIVAGRPSMGKTSFAMNIAENVALHEDKAVLVFSMEMPTQQLINRSVSSVGKVRFERIRAGNTLQENDFTRITAAVGRLMESNFIIDDTGGLSPVEVAARSRQVARNHDLGLIVVDYLQLMKIHGYKENRTNEISEISRSLKALAKELNVPLIALSQLNRSLENRPNKRPVMSDLRESGAIEQDADVIMFIYRDEVYNPDSPDKGTAEIITAKQRNGPIGTNKLVFLGEYTRFENHAKEQGRVIPMRNGYENGFQ